MNMKIEHYLILRWRNWSKTTKISSPNSRPRKDNWATEGTCKVSTHVPSCPGAHAFGALMCLCVCVHASVGAHVCCTCFCAFMSGCARNFCARTAMVSFVW